MPDTPPPTGPTVRDLLNAAAEAAGQAQNLGPRPAKAFVHRMPAKDLILFWQTHEIPAAESKP